MYSDTAQVVVHKPIETVFNFLSDPYNLDLWSFGTWKIEVNERGLVKGHALHTGQTNYVRIESHAEQGLIDYWVGPSADDMLPRICARIISGDSFASAADCSLLLLIALRTPDMDDQRWAGLIAAHNCEVGLIKSLLETGHDHRTMRS